MVLYSLGSTVTAFALSSEHSRMLPRRAIENQTAVRSTITRVGIKEKMVCCGVKGAYRRWMGEWQKKKATVRMRNGLSGIKWKTVFYMTVEGGTACLLFVGVVGWFVWMVVCSLGPPPYTALSWSLSRGRASPLQAGWVLRCQPNCHVNERLAGLHEPYVLVEVTSSVQPFTVLTEKAITSFSSNSCSANV